MKAKRRHELQQNVLASEIGKTVEFFRKWGTYIAWGLLVVALVILVVLYARSKTRQRAEQLQAKYDRLVTKQFNPSANLDDLLAGFRGLADQGDNRRIAADSCVYAGAVCARQGAVGELTSPALLLESPLQQAAEYYRRAISEFPDQSQAVAKAHFGLGKLAESRGDVGAARAEYQVILGMKALAGYPIVTQAEAAIEDLEALAEPVRMATTAPTTSPATAPATTASDPVVGGAAVE